MRTSAFDALEEQWRCSGSSGVRLLAGPGISDADACSIVSDNLQYSWDLRTLQAWNTELGEASES